MTCIVGLVDGDKVHLGADSMVSDGWRKHSLPEGKLWKSGELLLGASGTLRPLQAVRHHLTPPKRHEGQDSMAYLVSLLMPAVRQSLKDQDLWDATKATFEGHFLLGYRGHLYTVGSDLSVYELSDGYGASGSGAEFAVGALFASAGGKSKDRITQALEAAAYHELHVSPPFSIESV